MMFGVLRRVELGITTVRDARWLVVWAVVLLAAGFLAGVVVGMVGSVN